MINSPIRKSYISRDRVQDPWFYF